MTHRNNEALVRCLTLLIPRAFDMPELRLLSFRRPFIEGEAPGQDPAYIVNGSVTDKEGHALLLQGMEARMREFGTVVHVLAAYLPAAAWPVTFTRGDNGDQQLTVAGVDIKVMIRADLSDFFDDLHHVSEAFTRDYEAGDRDQFKLVGAEGGYGAMSISAACPAAAALIAASSMHPGICSDILEQRAVDLDLGGMTLRELSTWEATDFDAAFDAGCKKMRDYKTACEPDF